MAKTTNSNKNELFGGLNVGNFDEIDPKFICMGCKLVLFRPAQLLCCGTLFCEWCLRQGLSNSEPFTCPLCYTKQVKKEAVPDRGAERELKTISIVCYSCSWSGYYSDYLNHLQEFHADLECTDCQEHFFAINSFEQHRQELCIHRSTLCGLPDCRNSIKWYDMRNHYLSNQHQFVLHIIITKHIHPNQQQPQFEKRLENMKREHKDIQESIGIASSAVIILLNDLVRLITEISQIKTNFEPNVFKIEELTEQDKENEKSVKELVEKMNITQAELDNMKKTRDEDETLVLDNNATTTLRFTYPNTSSFSINSSKFQTSQYGYTFMLRACSTIVSKEEYLSLFLSLYNEKYNNLIPFPFSYDIHLVLWDQSNQQKHIRYVLKADLNSMACMRPTGEKNEEYGIIQFCPLRYLTDSQSIYVKDEVFFIRLFIDFLNNGRNPFQLNDNGQDIETMPTTAMITD